MRNLIFLPLVGGLVACQEPVDTGEEVVELEGPTLEHSPPEESLVSGGELRLDLQASDPDGVRAVTVYHRTQGSTYWESTNLTSDGDSWFVDLEELEEPGLEYYFKATDDGEDPATSYLPEAATAAPYAVEVLALAAALPWTEDFELLPEETSLFTMDWWTPTEAFSSYPWGLSFSDRVSGESSAWHERGADSVGELSDWLVSPALDFTGFEQIMVRWMERGASVDAMGIHGLYISTGSRDIESGAFEAVVEALPAPSSDWERSESYDLSAWAGSPVVYLAWHYQGQAADDWYLDDIEVLELAADLQATLAWAPDPVHPGETAQIAIAIDNHTSAEAVDLIARLSLPDGGGVIEDEEQDIALIEPDGTVDLAYSVALATDLHDNRRLPLVLEIEGAEDVWQFDLEMTVGLPSEAQIDLSLNEAASLQWRLGVGDPDDPSWIQTAHAGLVEAGEQTLTIDITDLYEQLPPEPGPLRWFSTVSADVDGSVEGFSLTYGGELFEASRAADFDVDSPATVFVPEPPDPTLVSLSPDTAEPGESVVTPYMVLQNQGEATAAGVEATLVSVDDGVSVIAGASFTLTADPWEADETISAYGPVLSISEDHTDSTPVDLVLELTDGVESWEVDVEIEVPWPVLKISRIQIDDSGGDGILDEGETANLEIEVTNTGGMSTFGTVSGVLSVETSSTAVASFTEDEGYFGSMSVGSSRDEDDFALELTEGSDGDSLDLLLSLDDGSVTYEARVSLTIGEPPWQSLSGTDDAIGDVIDGYDFDIVNGQYRIVDQRVEMILESAEPYDASTLFLEAWGSSSGADYIYYRWVLQAGSGTFQGYDSSDGFSVIGTMDVDFIDETHVMLSWDVEPMGLFGDGFSIGWAAGWCGPDEYYCDHFPNGWGYPYVSFSTSSWFDLEW